MARGETLILTVKFVTETCCYDGCGVEFAMTRGFYNECVQNPGVGTGRAFFCPNGHRQWYTGKSDAQRVKELEARVREQSEEVNLQRGLTELARREAKREKTRRTNMETRIMAGVCPKCKRTFSDLAEHMKMQHGKKEQRERAIAERIHDEQHGEPRG